MKLRHLKYVIKIFPFSSPHLP